LRKKVIISACLLGENCRYDGQTKLLDGLKEKYKNYEIIPFCPEAPLFGTPRQRISVIKLKGENRIFTDETNLDVTQILKDEIQNFCDKNQQVDEIILKSKSPSCGLGTTPILNEKRELLYHGNGIAGNIFLDFYKDVNIKDELTSK